MARGRPAAALAALTALAVTVLAAARDPQPVLPDESADWEYVITEDMWWPGPQRGCAAEERAGGEGGAELEVRCAPEAAGGARVTIATNRAGSYLTLKCEVDGNRAGNFTCEALQQNAGETLRKHMTDALAQRSGGARLLRSLTVDGCELSEPLQCVLALVAADDVATLALRAVPTPLQPRHVAGLGSLAHLRMLDVGKELRRLPYEALAALPALRRLDVQGGALELPAGGADWPPLPQLQMLELVQGGLRALPAGAFRNLSQLRNLSLWANEIETLDEGAFEGLSQLECLSLNSNRLRALPGAALRPTPRLRLLHLYGNRLAALPLLGHLHHLEEVWLNNGNETSLALQGDTFAELPELRSLRLEACGLAELPASLLRGSRALTLLSLRGNRLRELPAELLADQSTLRVLDVAYNSLRTLPRSFFVGAEALENLDLSSNEIGFLPNGTFLNLAAVKKLDLSRNKLNKLYSRVFEGLSGIEELSLAHNNLTMAGGVDALGRALSPLEELKSLRHVTLAHNAVHDFKDDWRDLLHLETLDLSHNNIEELSDVDLQMLGSAVVDVRYNKIARVKQLPLALMDTTEGLLSRARFLLDNNPFYCDCQMYDFLAALAKPKYAQQYNVERANCLGPPSLAGVLLKNVTLAALQCDLAASDCPDNCTCTHRPADYVLELDCARVPRELPEPAAHGARDLRLRLRSPLADLATLPPFVRVVDLSGLGLVHPPAVSARSLDLTVDLSNNSLTSAPLALLEANCKVLLAGNPLACDCEHQESVAGLRRYWARVHDGDALRCEGGGGAGGRLKDATALCARRDALTVGLASGVAVALVLLLLFRFRTEVRLLLGRLSLFDFLLPAKDARMLEKKYDAFVSFSHHDDEYVRNVLVPQLEGGRRPLRLCLHYRDWEVGDLIPDQIDRSVRESWRTIVVLSEDFVHSMWGRHEFRAAHGLERVIVLVLGDALRAMDADRELRAYKKTHTCIMASHPLVWDRIRDAVYRSKCAASVAADRQAEKKGKEAEAGEVALDKKGGLDVHLRNGQLVNEAAMKYPPSFPNIVYPDGKCHSEKVVEDETSPMGLIRKWFKSRSQDLNCVSLPK